MWGLLEEVTFEPRSGKGGRGKGENPRGTAFQLEGRAWAKTPKGEEANKAEA